MTPLDRVALADALASATAETLKADAEFIANAQTLLGNNDERFARLAALALAVAAMQERAHRNASELGYNPSEVRWTVDSDGDTHWHDGHMYGEAPRTLVAALAALLKGDQ